MITATGIKIFELPFDVPPFNVNIYSHSWSGKRGETNWLMNRLQSLAQSFDKNA